MTRALSTAILLVVTVAATNSRADNLLPIERARATDRAQAAQIRGLSINPLSILNPLAADRSARTPEVKTAMKTLVRYLAVKRAQGPDSGIAVFVDEGRFAVTPNGKIHKARTVLYKGGPGTVSYVSPVIAETGISAPRVTASIKDLARTIERGGDVPTRVVSFERR